MQRLSHKSESCCTATRCSTLQHTATCCNILQRDGYTLRWLGWGVSLKWLSRATHCNTLQRTAAHCNMMATHCADWCEACHTHGCVTSRTATHCNTLQHTATWRRHARKWVASHCPQLFTYHISHLPRGSLTFVYLIPQNPINCVMSHAWRSHVIFTNEACHAHDWVMSHEQAHRWQYMQQF